MPSRLVAERLERQHRAEDLALHDLRVVRARLDQRRLVPQAAALGDVAAAHDAVAAARGRAPRSPRTRAQVVAVDERRDGGGVVARVAQHVGVDAARAGARGTASVTDSCDQDARAGEADLAGVVVLAGGLGRGGVEVGVGEHQQRALAAELGRERARCSRPPRGRCGRAVSGEPVNDTRRTLGCATSAAPASSPMPCTTLNTPGGKPASTVRSASSEQDSGDHSAGLRITVQPAARAGARLPGREHERARSTA